MGPIEIRTERLLIRNWSDDDRDALQRIFLAPEVSKWSGVPDTATGPRAPFLERMRADQARFGWSLWAVELWAPTEGDPTGAIGWAGFGAESLPDPELAWTFHPSVWGRGYATEAGIACRDYGFRVLGMPRLVSVVDLRNVASARVAEKVGLRRAGAVECHGEPHTLFEIDIERWRRIVGEAEGR